MVRINTEFIVPVDSITYLNELKDLVESYTGEDIIIRRRTRDAAYAKFLFIKVALDPPKPFKGYTIKQIRLFLVLSDSNTRQYVLYYAPEPNYLKDLRILKRRLFTAIYEKIPTKVINKLLDSNKLTIEDLIDNSIHTGRFNREKLEKFADYLKDYCLTRHIDE